MQNNSQIWFGCSLSGLQQHLLDDREAALTCTIFAYHFCNNNQWGKKINATTSTSLCSTYWTHINRTTQPGHLIIATTPTPYNMPHHTRLHSHTRYLHSTLATVNNKGKKTNAPTSAGLDVAYQTLHISATRHICSVTAKTLTTYKVPHHNKTALTKHDIFIQIRQQKGWKKICAHICRYK